MNRDSILIEADELQKKLDNGNIRIFDATITDDSYLCVSDKVQLPKCLAT